jgi:CMP-2-keto-3-deoxyoctulosonic acid synthetase
MSLLKKRILIIIPTRIGSKRLKRKNLLKINNNELFIIVAKEALRSKFNPKVVVCSESKIVKKICKKKNINFILRPRYLSLDHIEKQEVIKYASKKLNKDKIFNTVVSLQPNSPQFKVEDLDKALKFFLKKVHPNAPIKEVQSVDKNNIQDGAFRIMTYKTVFQKTLSTKVGFYKTDYIDIHTIRDFNKVKALLER